MSKYCRDFDFQYNQGVIEDSITPWYNTSKCCYYHHISLPAKQSSTVCDRHSWQGPYAITGISIVLKNLFIDQDTHLVIPQASSGYIYVLIQYDSLRQNDIHRSYHYVNPRWSIIFIDLKVQNDTLFSGFSYMSIHSP